MFVPLKVTTDYSLLKSLIKIPNLIKFLHEKKINSCAICDENLFGCLDFYKTCKSSGIKPIIGLDIILNDFSLYLYAKNYNGYKNLLKIWSVIEERELSIIDLEKYKDDILIIIPYKSINLYKSLSFYEDIYIGFSNIYEKNNASIISSNIVYVNDIRVLDVNDIKYLEYLDILRKEEKKDYSNNFYDESNLVIDSKKIDEVVSKLNLEIPTNNNYIPIYNPNIDSYSFLKNLALKGLYKRFNGNVKNNYIDRLNYELNIINSMGFVNYFLIVYDYVLYAKKHSILVGPGRGSAAGSLVSFAIGITDIDPIKYDLLFERFLNPARVTMPDIDIDFDASKRDEVIKYVKSRYGYKNVAVGLTFNTMKSKLVLREVAKILNVDDDLTNKFLSVIDASINLKDNLKNEVVKKYLMNYPILKKVYQISMKLEGIKKNVSTHAAGVVISSVNLDEVIPIHINNGELQTGVAMEFLEDIGLLKMDFLGLKNLTTISNIINMIGNNVLKDIDLDKKEVYKLFSDGDTDGIFQFETPSMKSLVVKLKPNSFDDLIAGVALGRPGPREHADSFIKRKNGLEKITYIHPDLENILKNTYGILIYQEQIIAILVKIAGYSYQEADIVRRAISKKKDEVIKAERDKFISRAVKRNYSLDIASEIYDLIAKFASYGFNKSHSVAYALIAYQMAYLKVFYKEYFYIQFLNDSSNDLKISSYLNSLKNNGIKIYKPSINNSKLDYYISDKKLILPLWVIKNVSKEIAKKIMECKGKKYSDIFDFAYKTKDFMTANLMQILINAGAMDEFFLNHQTLIENIENAINYGLLADDDGLIKKPVIVEYEEYSSDKLRKDEVNSYGFYITNHPSSSYGSREYMKLINIDKYLYKKIKCVVLVDKIKVIKTKKNEDMAFIEASDETSKCSFTVFPNNFKMLTNIEENDLVLINGEAQKRFDKYVIIVNNIRKVGGSHE